MDRAAALLGAAGAEIVPERAGGQMTSRLRAWKAVTGAAIKAGPNIYWSSTPQARRSPRNPWRGRASSSRRASENRLAIV